MASKSRWSKPERGITRIDHPRKSMKSCLNDKREFAELRARLFRSLNHSHAPESSWCSPNGLQHQQCIPCIFYDQKRVFVLLKMHGKRRESPVAAMSGSNTPIELSHGGVCSPICSRACLPQHVQKIRGPSVLRDINGSEDIIAIARRRTSRQLCYQRWVRDRD